ncbi:MAG TPA: LuxR C-terminal-related transcriptional regulator [Candidatus Sulfotelmatobacter sp.]|jgi:ATP/maltotriose-dependent transcriptional regulator MalT
MPTPRPPECRAGDQALARGEWKKARRAYQAALRNREVPEALEGLGNAAWWLDQAELVFDSRERAYRVYLRKKEKAAAARVAVWLAWDYWAFRGENVVANGWLQRARHLLEGGPACSEKAWLELREASLCLFEEGDALRAIRMAEKGMEVAREVGSIDLEMLGLAVRGLAHVIAGNVPEGMRNLDEVNTAVIARELEDPVIIGLSSCYLIAACEKVRDYERALQWCKRLKIFCTKWRLRPLFAVCRTQYASICLWRGTWDEAEAELISAREELAASRPAMTGDAIVRLAELRRRQGKLSEAARLYDEAPGSVTALLGRAQIAFDRGEQQSAIEQAERYLRRVPPGNRLERAPALELLVRALTDMGELKRARSVLGELSSLASAVGTIPLRAAASYASGCLAIADSHADEARQHFEDAADLFLQSSAPYEHARARADLALALGKLGRFEAAVDEAKAAIQLFSKLDAAVELARTRAALNSLNATKKSSDAVRSTSGKKVLTKREIEVLRLVADGQNNQSIAGQLRVSDHTVHRHLANILNKLSVSTRAAAVAQAARRNLFS